MLVEFRILVVLNCPLLQRRYRVSKEEQMLLRDVGKGTQVCLDGYIGSLRRWCMPIDKAFTNSCRLPTGGK